MRRILCLLCIALTLLLVSPNALLADDFIWDGGYSSASGLKYWTDPSVSSYGYSSHTQHAGGAWNGISSGVNISSQSSESGAHIVVYAGTLSNQTWYAAADYYVANWLGLWTQVTQGEYRERTRIRINDYTMDRDNFGTDHAKKTITHEFGHALSLKDIFELGYIMTPGKETIIYPTAADQQHLISKWCI